MTVEAPPPPGVAEPIGDDAPGAAGFEALYRGAVAAVRAKDEQLALLAHELRNPLHAIMTSAEVLKRAAIGSRDATSAADVIARQVRRLATLIDLRLPLLSPLPLLPPGAKTHGESPTIAVGTIDDADSFTRSPDVAAPPTSGPR